MKSYLVPMDFSEAAFNAANFAARLSHETDVGLIVLMNAYYISPYEAMLPNTDLVMLRQEEIEEDAVDRLAQLEQLKTRLLKLVRNGVVIRTQVKRSHLVRAVVDTVTSHKIDLVILGTIGNSTVREGGIGIGDHVIKISKVSPVPVLVVPPDYTYHIIESVVIACDFKKVKDSVPAEALKKLLGRRPVELLVLNVEVSSNLPEASPQQVGEDTALHQMLKGLKPRYHYINHPKVITGVLNFALENNAQLVIALPHTYSFMQSLLHSSISEQLATSSSVPVLLLK
ncbi:hypothetical protein A0256_16350 [Mucilaginibacter sp. PAMC 26640]|nr:hypothetical protein A0256_16350 [Mucilaginibacter sp. PAMC 26640]